jgi:hypothetical protein
MHPSTESDFLVEIIPRLFHMPFPDDGVAEKYAKILNMAY